MGKILAHELAHVLGVHHDGDNNKCEGKIKAHRFIKQTTLLGVTYKLNRIMTPVISFEASMWSKCSRKQARKILRDGQHDCLYV